MLPVNQIDTFYNGLTLRHRDTINAAARGTLMRRHPEECYDLIENMSAYHNDWDTSGQRITSSCETCGGPHSISDCPATFGNTQNVYAAGASQVHEDEYRFIFGFENSPSPTIKTLLTNKNKLSELARTPINEHCLAVILKKFPKKLGDPGEFLISYDFPGMAKCLALADLDASINLMPLFMWNKLSLLDLSPTCMTLELVDRLISYPDGVAEDVFVKTGRALIDVFEGELTLRVGKEAKTFNLDQTSRYSANYNDMTANRIDVIDMAYKEYSQEVLGFSNLNASGNPTPYYDPIVSTNSLTLTPFGNSDFLLKEVDTFLALEDDPTSSEVDQSYVDTEGDIILLEAFLNDDPSLPPLNQGNFCLKFVRN
nr:reverse transcriptase domain-containing protein [Tanacetum cinerariifolium]